MPWGKESFPRIPRSVKLPVVLSAQEVSRLFENVGCLKYRAVLMLCYGAGLRISEAIGLRIGDIDSARMLIRIVEGKGRKDRYVMLPERLLKVLRCYWRATLRKTTCSLPGGKAGTSRSRESRCRVAARRKDRASRSESRPIP